MGIASSSPHLLVSVWHIDAFTSRPFAGNPAAVCWLGQPRDAAWCQQVAAELNLSETAFLVERAGEFGLRWFTPVTEVDLCGHATLASAHYLWESGRLAAGERAVFHTRSGRLTAEAAGGCIVLDFPARPAAPAETPEGLADALGLVPVFVGRSADDLLVVGDDPVAVRRCAPDLTRLARLPVRGVIITAPGDEPGVDFVSRFFAPRAGVPEDPVTGSAHCTLAPYWAGRAGKNRLTGFQASRRGGTVEVELRGDRVRLGGRAVTVMKGTLG